jgi:hypothetical protein
MARRLTQVERAARSLNAPPFTGPRVGNVMWEGVKASEPWSPPQPHGRVQVSLGDDVHKTLHKAPERAPSIAEQIADMVNRSRS